MAQRRGTRGKGHMAARLGLVGAQLPMAALVALACAAGGAGVLARGGGAGMVVERAGDAAPQEGAGGADGGGAQGAAASGGTAEGAAGSGEKGAEVGGGSEPKAIQRCLVHVDGAVASPGVVELEGADLRVYDAVEKAGGLLDDADTSAVNLAEALQDGAKIHIPHEGEEPAAAPAAPSGQAQTSGATGAGGGSTLVNINTATAEELRTLSGVGEATAAAIVRDREQNGPFSSPEDLMRVSGIGEKKFAKVEADICV